MRECNQKSPRQKCKRDRLIVVLALTTVQTVSSLITSVSLVVGLALITWSIIRSVPGAVNSHWRSL